MLIANHNTALELLLPQTHFVIRGSIPQRVSNWERANMNHNTALELLLPQTHFVIRGSIPQRVSNWERANMNLNTALELFLPQTHFLIRGSILQHFHMVKFDCERCAGATFASDTFRGQRWHSPTHSNWQTGQSFTIFTGITGYTC